MSTSIKVLDNDIKSDKGEFLHAWFRIQTQQEQHFRVIVLKELATVPVSSRDDVDLLAKQWAAVRGLHNAGVDFVYSACGIFEPEHVGLLQFYGAAAHAITLEEAIRLANQRMAAVESTLASGYQESKLCRPALKWIEWYINFVSDRGKHLLVLLGHPDPRETRRGLGKDGQLPIETGEDLASEQNEILFRGLAKLREDFVFQITSQHVERRQVTDALVRVAQITSNVASRRRGSINIGFSLGIPLIAALSQSYGGGFSRSRSTGQSVSDGVSHGWGRSEFDSQAHTEIQASSQGITETQGYSETKVIGESQTQSHGLTMTQGQSQSETRSSNWGRTATQGQTNSLGGSIKASPMDVGVTGDYSHSWQQSESQSIGGGLAQTQGQFSSESQFQSESISQSESLAQTNSRAVSRMQSFTKGFSDTVGHGEGRSENWGRSHVEAGSQGQLFGRNGMHGFVGGFSTGLIPGVSLNRSWQTEDDVAERLTEVLRQLEGLLNQASAEGGFMTDATLITATERGATAAEALVPQAFHGVNVPTPVLTIKPNWPEVDHLRQHTQAFLPWNDIDPNDPFNGLLWTKFGTLLTASQLAAYTAPGLFEEGTAVTVMAPIPTGMGFYSQMPGDVILGHQYSPETADLTNAPVRIDESRLMHTLFGGDTGWGKSVAAIRMAYETTLNWKLRTVVLDFGAGWRQLLNAPGLEGHVDILQLWPDAARPLRWNPLQIGRHINPETQWRAFADIFGTIARLGVRRQKQELLQALRNVYIRAGVLVDDPEVRADPEWGVVQADEANRIEAGSGIPIGDLDREQRQRLAVYRSSKVGLANLYEEIQRKLESVPPRDTMLTGVLEGILFRMNALVQGAAAAQFAPGEDTMPMEDLSKPWGITIIEGGIFLDDFGKAFLLGWAGWHLYIDMVSRRVHEVGADEPVLQIFFEEANKIFGGVDDGDGERVGISVSQRFGDMFRDARKYRSRLHVVTQAPSMIPQDIISSCNNLVVGFLKNPTDKDIVLSALARSEKGFRDEEWRRFLADEHIGMAIGRFPYTMKRELQRPILFKPLIVDAPEPTDEEIELKLGSISL